MKRIEMLGSGGSNCRSTVKLIDEVAAEKGGQIALEKFEDFQSIVKYGIMATPGVVIDGAVVQVGGVPARSKVEGWF